MTNFGIFIMITSNLLVIGLLVYCFWRVLKTPQAERHEHSPLAIDTRDDDHPY